MLHHVSLEVPPEEADRSIEFWGLLGFEEVPAADVLGDSVRWLERDATQVHLILTEGHTAPALGHAAVSHPITPRPSGGSATPASRSRTPASSGAPTAPSPWRRAATGSS